MVASKVSRSLAASAARASVKSARDVSRRVLSAMVNAGIPQITATRLARRKPHFPIFSPRLCVYPYPSSGWISRYDKNIDKGSENTSEKMIFTQSNFRDTLKWRDAIHQRLWLSIHRSGSSACSTGGSAGCAERDRGKRHHFARRRGNQYRSDWHGRSNCRSTQAFCTRQSF